MAQSLTPQQVESLIKKVSGDIVLEEQQISLNQFKIICNNYIKAVNQEIGLLKTKERLKTRIEKIGRLLHKDISFLPVIQILSDQFQASLNNFLGRQVTMAWASFSGDIKLSDKATTLAIHSQGHKAAPSGKKSYRQKIRNVNLKTFEDVVLNTELQELQDAINKSTQNKKAVFGQALRRYDESPTMNYAIQDKGSIKNIYWSLNKRGTVKSWSEKIPVRGYVGEGYVAMILQTAEETVPNIIFGTPQNLPPYDNINAERYLRILSSYAIQGDNAPGLLKGDVKAKENGNIQLAIKQGPDFHTASFALNFAVAYAVLYRDGLGLQTDAKWLRQNLESVNILRWESLFKHLTGVASKELKGISIEMFM